MWPLGLLRGLDLGVAMIFVVSLLDAAMVPVVYSLVAGSSKNGRNRAQRWAWWAGLVMSAMPLAFRALAFGILPTIFAQSLTLPALAIPILWPERLRSLAWFVLWVLLLAASMVAFPTTLVFNTLVIGVIAIAWFRLRAAPPGTWWLLIVGLACALVVSFLAYYNLYVGPLLSNTLPALARGTTVGGNPLWPGGALELLGWTGGYVVNWLPLLLLPLAIAYKWGGGYQTMGTGKQAGQHGSGPLPRIVYTQRLETLLVALFFVLVLGIVLNLRFDMIGKHLYYTMPASAIAAGLVLSRLWLRGTGGGYPRALSVLAALSIALSALALMAGRV
jgi:hypothetical protein